MLQGENQMNMGIIHSQGESLKDAWEVKVEGHMMFFNLYIRKALGKFICQQYL